VRIGFDASGKRIDPYELALVDRPDLTVTVPDANEPTPLQRPTAFPASRRGALDLAV
jgi:hypothetical protein